MTQTDTDIEMDTDQDTDDGMSFEERLGRLEEVVDRLESDDVGLDESLSLYEEGVRLLNDCRGRLDDVETQVEAIGDAEIQISDAEEH